ncbi:MAG TPA: HIT family protein [Ferrovibrio sp.]|jgi:diadenosine tetraphosphate (Ap4A) HIT family hydrolase|uniref:HIT family protein n=1 Tax=Ferrovibrio sp. TaxID=1917215 RepID=UPI002B4B8C12|nr:HIT family protein [Ferrovibrio sp.]HLT78639.1 HIT family protein [Ferrovibrio sp.]
MFTLHDQLRRDTLPVCRLKLCLVQLMNDSRYPWLILIPTVENVTEIVELNEKQRKLLINEIAQVQTILGTVFQPHKLNVGALGNMVPQLHVHVIARFRDDAAWPGPVWGKLPPQPYEESALRTTIARLQKAFIARA